VELHIPIDVDKIFESKIGQFGFRYYHFINGKRRRKRPKDIGDKIGRIIYHALGKCALAYLHFFTNLYFRSLSEEELRKLNDELAP